MGGNLFKQTTARAKSASCSYARCSFRRSGRDGGVVYVQRCVIKVARSFRHRPTKGTSAFIPGKGMEELQPNALRSS